MVEIYRGKDGRLISDGDTPAAQLVTLGDAAYNWGTAAATLGQRPRYIRLAAGAPRILTMPAEALCAGWEVFVTSTGISTVQVNNDAGVGVGGTIATLATGHFYCDGTTWFAFGEAPAS